MEDMLYQLNLEETEAVSLRTFMSNYLWDEMRDTSSNDENALYLASILNVYNRLAAMLRG